LQFLKRTYPGIGPFSGRNPRPIFDLNFSTFFQNRAARPRSTQLSGWIVAITATLPAGVVGPRMGVFWAFRCGMRTIPMGCTHPTEIGPRDRPGAWVNRSCARGAPYKSSHEKSAHVGHLVWHGLPARVRGRAPRAGSPCHDLRRHQLPDMSREVFQHPLRTLRNRWHGRPNRRAPPRLRRAPRNAGPGSRPGRIGRKSAGRSRRS
jgi:hypothetical protein